MNAGTYRRGGSDAENEQWRKVRNELSLTPCGFIPHAALRFRPTVPFLERCFNENMTTLQHRPTRAAGNAAFSIPSILAIIAAIASFVVSPGYQLLLSIAAAVLGFIGVIVALMPGVRGGIISFISLVIGAIGAIIAIIRLVASL
jgi:hypothetical protein